jgi:predicted DNA-binding transcriptional regulator AlpA
LLTVAEEKLIISNLKYLAEKGELKPVVVPKLIDQKEAAEMLGIGHSSFKKLEASSKFPFKRKMVGSAVRYRNTDVIDYILG